MSTRDGHRVFLDCVVGEIPGACWLSEAESHRLRRVLRLKEGAALVVTDATGKSYAGSIIAFSKARVEVGLHHALDFSSPAEKHRVCVFMALPRVGGSTGSKARIDDLIFPLSELGATEIVPMVSEFSVVKPQAEKWMEKRERFLRLSIESAKQCGRQQPLQVGELTDFEKVLAEPFDLGFILDPDPRFFVAAGDLMQRLKSVRETTEAWRLHLLIGPEGGFSHAEILAAEKKGYDRLCFNSNILRTPTAVISALAVFGFMLR